MIRMYSEKNNIVIIVYFKYFKFIVSIICGGNRTKLSLSLVHRK